MGHSLAVGFLWFGLCFVACVFVSADGNNGQEQSTEVSADKVKQAVDAAKKSIKEVSDNAKTNLTNTKGVLQKVESSKNKADKAAVEAGQEAKDNDKAKAIVENIKTIAQGVTGQHTSEKGKLNNTISSLKKVVSEAEKLQEKCNAVLPSTDTTPKNYLEAQTNALGIKQEADKLNTNITEALAAINGVSSTADDMENKANDAELKKLHVSGIVAVAEIDTIIRDTGSDIQETEDKKKEVNGVVQAMQELKKKFPSQSTEHINKVFRSTNDELRKATAELNKSEQYTTELTTQKQKADAALVSIETANEVTNAQREVDTAKECVRQVKTIVPLLKSALQTAKSSVTKATASKKKLEEALSITTTAPSTPQITETKKSDPPIGDSTETDQTDTTIQPTSKDALGQIYNSTDKRKDELNKGAQNVPTTALTGGKAPAPGANNDSAMTVSVPLLVALIASAVLQ